MEKLSQPLFFCPVFHMVVIHDLLKTFCRNLRELFKIDAADYMMSICGNDALRELSSPGKSGSVFFLSQDDRFMIKTLRRSEVKVCSFYIDTICGYIITAPDRYYTSGFL